MLNHYFRSIFKRTIKIPIAEILAKNVELCVKGPGIRPATIKTKKQRTKSCTTGGENLYPVEIENFIRKHDAVKDVAVIGLPHARLGEIAAAIVELKPEYEMSEGEFNDFCMGMPRYKRPRKVIFANVPR